MPLDFLSDGPEDARRTVALAHGAGAAMDTPFMTAFAGGLAAWGFRVARFEFPYMAARRATGKKRGPDRPNVLLDTWFEAVRQLGDPSRLVIGGKSMGGRIASMIADEAGVAGLLCLGYPFHTPGKPEVPRIDHLAGMRTPALILQGTRDPFGTPDEVAAYPLSPAIRLHWLADGDHGFKPRKRSGRTEEQNLSEAVEAAATFMASL
ncbi:MAG: dienelactone hydrolase family protein [Rhodospirillales bacterium]|nr:dienelactone hydrolase family protein [Rhodospirillales bacterium]